MRWHLFEFEDLASFPDVIREGMTDYLRFILKRFRIYDPVAPLLENAIQKTDHKIVIDLCSGGGGPLEALAEKIDPTIIEKFYCSDLFPNIPAYENLKTRSRGRIDYFAESTNGLNPTLTKKGFLTLFSSIHHFRDEDVKAILENAIAQDLPVGIFDGGDKNIWAILSIVFGAPLIFFFCTPLFRPFKVSRLIFTYLLPAIPACTVWDGVVSILRLYHPEELLAIANAADTEGEYEWDFGKKRSPLGFQIAYLIGISKTQR